MPTTFSLVRHGAYPLLHHAIGGRACHALSDEGRAQAGRVADTLAGAGIRAVVSSPVTRARETAELIGGRLGVAVQLDADFAEIDYGDWTGRQFQDLDKEPAWVAWNMFRGSAGVPGGESMLAVQARAVAGLIRLAGAYPESDVAVVSHGDVIKAVLAHFLGAPLDLLRRMEIGAGSISRVVLYDQDARVLGLNASP